MIEIIRDPLDMQPLAKEWNELAEAFQTPLLRHEWFAACAGAFCPPGRLSIIVMRAGGKITGIAPLVLMRQGRLERLELLGTAFVFEPSGFLYADVESLRELLNAIMDLQRPLLLTRLPFDSAEVRIMHRMCRRRALCVFKKAEGSPWLSISSSWGEFEATISSSRRASLRRGQKRAEELGKVRYEILSPHPEELGLLLEDIFRVEAAGWKGEKGTSLLSNERLRQFVCLYCKATAGQGVLRLGFLKIDEQIVAFQVAVQHAKRLWLFKIGYDEVWARCSPGMLLMHASIRHAFESGLEAYEFLGDDEPWIHVWTDKVRPHLSTRIYPLSFTGLVNLGLDTSRFVLSRATRSKR